MDRAETASHDPRGPHDEEVPATQRNLAYQGFRQQIIDARIRPGQFVSQRELMKLLGMSLAAVRDSEIERGVTLVGPHRDDLVLSLGQMPAKGYASHGESWSVALGLKLGAYHLLRHDLDEDPVLVLDDVFAELDSGRRERLAGIVADCEQVLITAAVEADIPASLHGTRHLVTRGSVTAAEAG